MSEANKTDISTDEFTNALNAFVYEKYKRKGGARVIRIPETILVGAVNDDQLDKLWEHMLSQLPKDCVGDYLCTGRFSGFEAKRDLKLLDRETLKYAPRPTYSFWVQSEEWQPLEGGETIPDLELNCDY